MSQRGWFDPHKADVLHVCCRYGKGRGGGLLIQEIEGSIRVWHGPGLVLQRDEK